MSPLRDSSTQIAELIDTLNGRNGSDPDRDVETPTRLGGGGGSAPRTPPPPPPPSRQPSGDLISLRIIPTSIGNLSGGYTVSIDGDIVGTSNTPTPLIISVTYGRLQGSFKSLIIQKNGFEQEDVVRLRTTIVRRVPSGDTRRDANIIGQGVLEVSKNNITTTTILEGVNSQKSPTTIEVKIKPVIDVDIPAGPPQTPVPPISIPEPRTPSLKVKPKSFTFDIDKRPRLNVTVTELTNADAIHITNEPDIGKRFTRQVNFTNDEIRNGKTITLGTDWVTSVGRYRIIINGINRSVQPNIAGGFTTIIVNAVKSDQPEPVKSVDPPIFEPEIEVLPPPPPPPPPRIAQFTEINFPKVIEGADYKEFDADFSVSYKTLFTNNVNIEINGRSYGSFGKEQTVKFNVNDLITKFGINGSRNPSFLFAITLSPILNGEVGITERIQVQFNMSPLQLTRGKVVDSWFDTISNRLDFSIFDDINSKHLTHIASFDNIDFKLISSWDIDKTTFTEFEQDEINNLVPKEGIVNESLVLKLFEPLPTSVQPNTQLWISKLKSTPYIDEYEKKETEDDQCIRLRPANFDIVKTDSLGYEIFDEIVGSGSISSTEVIDEFLSRSGVDTKKLNIQYRDTDGTILFENFVHFGSAEEQVINSVFKIKLLESIIERIDELSTVSSTIINQKETKRLEERLIGVKRGFTGFESFIFREEYPTDVNGELLPSNDIIVSQWYQALLIQARNYDKNNPNNIVNNLPSHIQVNVENEEFLLFFNMVGQHYDIIWSYINGIKTSKILEENQNKGIIDDLVYHMVSSFGWDLNPSVAKQQLWELAFGHIDGQQTDTLETTGSSYQRQIWRRILNNLPYLLKNKGTRQSIRTILNTYGIPQSLLTIIEFGGPKTTRDDDSPTKFTFDEQSASLIMEPNSFVSVDWNDINGDKPNCIELRLKSTSPTQQTILENEDGSWSLEIIPHNSPRRAFLRFSIQTSSGEQIVDSPPFVMFNDEYKQILVNRTVNNGVEQFSIFAQEGVGERIINSTFVEVVGENTEWNTGNIIKVGSGLIGSLDEVRLWRIPLRKSRFDNHTLSPDSIDGNDIRSSTEDLLLRFDFEFPKNRGIDTTIKNVAPDNTYSVSGEAVGFASSPTYPFSHVVYERTSVSNIPSVGIAYSNKVRIEDIELVQDLSSKSRSTRKAFDRSPVDTNRLGLFFSPIKELNMDIIKTFGDFRIDDFIGRYDDIYTDEYKDLRSLRKYYFERINLNIYEYIRLVRYIDKSIFKMMENVIPLRARVAKGLLIEPHFLERSKVRWTKPEAEGTSRVAEIDVTDKITTEAEYLTQTVDIVVNDEINFLVTLPMFIADISVDDSISVQGESLGLIGDIEYKDQLKLTGAYLDLVAHIDAQFPKPILIGEIDWRGAFTEIGGGGFSNPAIGGFGIIGNDGFVRRVFRDINNNIRRENLYVERLVKKRVETFPFKADEVGTIDRFEHELNSRPSTDNTPTPLTNEIIKVTPVDGLLPAHYIFSNHLSEGLRRSYFRGSINSERTTIDGSSAVEVFVTNPNILRVSDSGRGSGDPILIVE